MCIQRKKKGREGWFEERLSRTISSQLYLSDRQRRLDGCTSAICVMGRKVKDRKLDSLGEDDLIEGIGHVRGKGAAEIHLLLL